MGGYAMDAIRASMEPKIFDMGAIGGKKFVCFNEKIKDIMKEYDAIQFQFKENKFAIVGIDDLVLLLNEWKERK
jgi:hypothetical protein